MSATWKTARRTLPAPDLTGSVPAPPGSGVFDVLHGRPGQHIDTGHEIERVSFARESLELVGDAAEAATLLRDCLRYHLE